MSVLRFLHGKWWLMVSVAINIILLYFCLFIIAKAQHYYTEYRHFRPLAHGTSESSTVNLSTDRQEKVLIIFGDSRVSEWNPLPRLNNTQVLNAGIAGETTTEIRRRLQHDVLRHSPDYVLIQAGMNDLTAAATRGIANPNEIISTMQANFKFLLSSLAENGIKVVLTPVLPNKPIELTRKLFLHDRLSSLLAETNSFLQDIAAENSVLWLDLTPLVYKENGELKNDWYVDILHFNDTAYRAMNTHVVNAVKSSEQQLKDN